MDGVVGVVVWSTFTSFHKDVDVLELRLGLDPHVDGLEQLDGHRISSALHPAGEITVLKDVKSVAEGAEVGLGEDVVGVVHVEAAGDAQEPGEPAAEVDVDRAAADYHLVGQLEGRDGVGVNQVVPVDLQKGEPVGTVGWEWGGRRLAGGATNLFFGSTGVEGHDADDVGAVGGQGAAGVLKLQEGHVQVWHGGLGQGHRDPVWQALDGGDACNRSV